jgi:hypothetical protein
MDKWPCVNVQGVDTTSVVVMRARNLPGCAISVPVPPPKEGISTARLVAIIVAVLSAISLLSIAYRRRTQWCSCGDDEQFQPVPVHEPKPNVQFFTGPGVNPKVKASQRHGFPAQATVAVIKADQSQVMPVYRHPNALVNQDTLEDENCCDAAECEPQTLIKIFFQSLKCGRPSRLYVFDALTICLILAVVFTGWQCLLWRDPSLNPLGVFTPATFSAWGIPTDNYDMVAFYAAIDRWNAVGSTASVTLLFILAALLFLRTVLAKSLPDIVVAFGLLMGWIGQLLLYFGFPLFVHFSPLIKLKVESSNYLVDNPDQASTASHASKLSFSVMATTYVCNMQTFILHALPAGILLGSVLWRLSCFRVQDSKNEGEGNYIDEEDKSDDEDDEDEGKRMNKKDTRSATQVLGESMLRIPSANAIYNNYILAYDLFTTVLCIFIPIALIAPALVLFYLVGGTYAWMSGWGCYFGACYCCVLFISTLSKAKRLDRIKFSCTAQGWTRYGTLIASFGGAIFLFFTSLTICMQQENTFPFFRLHYTVVVWCQIASLTATTSTTIYVLIKDKTNRTFADILVGKNVEDDASKAAGSVISKIVSLLFSPFVILIEPRRLLHRIVEAITPWGKSLSLEWSELNPFHNCDEFNPLTWCFNVLRQLVMLPLLVLYHTILFPFAFLRCVCFLLGAPISDKLPKERIHYRNLYMLIGCILLTTLLIYIQGKMYIPAKELFSQAALSSGTVAPFLSVSRFFIHPVLELM